MKRNLFFLLALVTVGACGGSSRGTMQIRWSLTEGGSTVACASGDYVEIDSISGSQRRVDKYDCTDLGAQVSLPPGTWDVTITLLDVGNNVLADPGSFTAVIASNRTTDVGTAVFQLASGGLGTISVTWQVYKNGGQTTCAAVGAVTLRIHSTPVAGGPEIVDKFDCSDMAGTQADLNPGTYHVAVDLLNASNQMLNLYTFPAIVTVAADANTQLDNVAFSF